MRSKTLHRDEDMLQDALKAKVATFFPAIVCIVLGRSLGTRLTQSESIDTAMSVILVWVCVLQISYYSPSLLSHFKTMDTNNSGKVSSHLLQVNKLPLSHLPSSTYEQLSILPNSCLWYCIHLHTLGCLIYSQLPGSPHLRVWEQASTTFSCDSHCRRHYLSCVLA